MLANQITVTAEYLPSSLNVQADWESRNHKDSSNLKLNSRIFSQIVNIRGVPQIDLFVSRLSNQLPKYVLVSRSGEFRSGLPSILVEETLWICVPSILYGRKGTSQSQEEPLSTSHHNTNKTNSTMVHNFTLNVSLASNTSTQSEFIVKQSPRADTSITRNQPTTTSDMDVFRKVLESEGVSELTATLSRSCGRSGLNV